MYKYILVGLLVLLIACPLFGQAKSLGDEPNSVQFNVKLAPIKLKSNGEKRFLDSSSMFGVKYPFKGNLGLEVGVYLLPTIMLGNGEDSNFSSGFALDVGINKYSVGFFYDFWLEGEGFVGLRKSNTGFLVSYDVDLSF
ncbi:MAG: hypothetical protein ACXABY_19815 [Candidatus Thorarchaeota archaeon]|jgi:hypothetical protein